MAGIKPYKRVAPTRVCYEAAICTGSRSVNIIYSNVEIREKQRRRRVRIFLIVLEFSKLFAMSCRRFLPFDQAIAASCASAP